jgi:hypothetical protein
MLPPTREYREALARQSRQELDPESRPTRTCDRNDRPHDIKLPTPVEGRQTAAMTGKSHRPGTRMRVKRLVSEFGDAIARAATPARVFSTHL